MNSAERGSSGGRYMYEFRSDQEVAAPDGCGIEVSVGRIKADGALLSTEGFTVFLALDSPLSGSLVSATLVVKLWYILEARLPTWTVRQRRAYM